MEGQERGWSGGRERGEERGREAQKGGQSVLSSLARLEHTPTVGGNADDMIPWETLQETADIILYQIAYGDGIAVTQW